MLIPIERGAREPVAKQIVQYLRRAIEGGRLRTGAKLEPIRVLAKALGVNRETVAAAYHELEILGLTESTVGRGTFVLARAAASDGREAIGAERGRPRSFEPVFSRRSAVATSLAAARVDYAAAAGVVHLERLIPDASLVPDEDFRKALNRALRRGGPALYDYGDPRGLERLRRALVERLTGSGIECGIEDVLITAGSTQGFAVVAQLFCDPGDAVAVESPTYPWALGALRAHGLRAAPVPMGPDGLDLDRLDAVLARGDVRLIYTMPSFQNPTAVSTTVAHRRQLLDIAAKHGVPILEDDFEKDLRVRGRGAPPLRALDRDGRVIYLGTFSKALFPAVRVGWLVAPRPIADGAATVKRLMDITTSPLLQAGLAQFLAEGSYDRHLRNAVRVVAQRLAAAERALSAHLPRGAQCTVPDGGYLLWVNLPEAIDSAALLADAKRAGVLYAPGQIFFPDERRSSACRLSLAQATPGEIERGVRLLGQVTRAALSRRRRDAAGAPTPIHL
jgi:DNA-binding transcriptional MocR family regulator